MAAHIRSVHFEDILIPEDRQRQEFVPEGIITLASSISQSSLLHPPVFRTDSKGQKILVAGERRIRAMEYLWNFGESVKCAGQSFPEWHIPYIDLGDLDPIDAEEAELDENLHRANLTWQELASAQARLLRLRTAQAERDGKPAPEIADVVAEVAKTKNVSEKGIYSAVRQNILLAKHLGDPEVAKARSADEAMKLLRRKEEATKNEALALSVGRTLTAASHTLLTGDCLKLLSEISSGQFDVVLSDPPYGIDAQDFNDSGGAAGGGTDGGHRYDDSYTEWERLMNGMIGQATRVTKPQAHMYLFCDIDRFHELRQMVGDLEIWKPFRTPFIWHNPTSNRAPWPEHGPHRKYQCILYAVKGSKPVTKLYPDVIVCASDPNLGHHAQKPVALLVDLLRRSISPGDLVLDPFCGSGSIFPAAHSLKCIATGMEVDPASAGIAMKRMGELK